MEEIEKMKEITNTEIVDYALGEASEETARRVVVSALLDTHVAEKLKVAYSVSDAKESQETSEESKAEKNIVEAVALKTRSQILSLMHQKPTEISREDVFGRSGGGFFRQGTEFQMRIRAWSDEVLEVGRQLLTLPCLAPAMAAATTEHTLRRESVTTPEGVRVEFQQLPGAVARLRLVLDASIWQERGYVRGFVTLEEGEDRHILMVILNAQGRGFTDFVMGESPQNLPPSRRGLHLVSISFAK